MGTKDFLIKTNCNLCGANDYKIVFEDRYGNETATSLAEKFKSSGDETLIDQVVKCNHCGLIYVNPRIKSELILNGYSEGSDEAFVSQAKARERTFERCLNIIEKYTKKKKGKILDIGTANGSFLYVAKKRGWEVDGIEPNKWLCEWAKKNYGIEIKSMTLLEQTYPNETFDVITLWDVLEHVDNPLKVLSECQRIIKKDGILIVNYPDIGSWIARIMGRKWFFLLSVHLFYFTPKTIKKMLKKTSFDIIKTKPHFQSLELGYLIWRMRKYNTFFHKIGYKIIRFLNIENLQVPYWLGQTLVISKNKKSINSKLMNF